MVAAMDGSGEKRNSSESKDNSRPDADPLQPPQTSASDHDHHHGGPEAEAQASSEELRTGPASDNLDNGSGENSSSPKGSPRDVIVPDVVLRPPPHLPQPEAPPGVGVPGAAFPAAIAKSATTNGRVAVPEGGGGEAVMDRSRSAGAGRTGGGEAVMDRSRSAGAGRTGGGGGIGSYIRETGSAWARRFSMGGDRDSRDDDDDEAEEKRVKQLQHLIPAPMVTEYHLSGVRVIVRVKEEAGDGPEPEVVEPGSNNQKPPAEEARPQPATRQPSVTAEAVSRASPPPSTTTTTTSSRITFFSRSNCRDCGAVRSFFRSHLLPYVEINVDVFPSRLKELVRRAGSASVPQIFFNGRLVGGLVALNSLRNSGEFDRRMREMMAMPVSGGPDAGPPDVPVLGVDDDDEEDDEWKEDPLAGLARAMRERVVVGDRIARMKLVRGCFSGSELVEAVIEHLDCGRKKAIEMCRELERRHFLHHAFRDQHQQQQQQQPSGGVFQDGPAHLYRFLDHDPAVYRCYNMGLGVSYRDPRPAAWVGQRITKIMQAILEAYASDDRKRLDYNRIAASEEFRRYVKVAQELQRLDAFALPAEDRLTFFLNLYNAMVIHAVICMGRPEGGSAAAAAATAAVDRYYGDFHYMVGGYPYSLSTVKNGILRANRRQPYSIARTLGAADKRLELAPAKLNPLIHFGLCNSARSSPPVCFFSPQGVDAELRDAAREFFRSGGIAVDLEKRTVHLTRIIKWFSADFGQDKDILNWILNFLDATRAGLLTHLLSDGGPVNIAYQNYDWSLNI